MKATILKFKNSTSNDFKELNANEVNSIIPSVDKYGEPCIIVNFYDDEFCMDATLICEEIEFENKEI